MDCCAQPKKQDSNKEIKEEGTDIPSETANEENVNSANKEGEKKEKNILRPLVFMLIGALIGILIYENLRPVRKLSQQTPDLAAAVSYLKFKEIKASTIPSGAPAIYGEKLNISFDKAQEAINKVALFDPTYGGQKIVLTGDDLKRYIKIGSLTACQYCCEADVLVNPDGQAACGCEHSQMMRGLIAYLLKNQPGMSDEQILAEINKWKAVFFPKQTLTAKLAELEKTGDTDVKALLEEFPDFLPQMIGGC